MRGRFAVGISRSERAGLLAGNGIGHALAVGRVGLGAVRYVLLHDVLGHAGDVARRVLEQALLRIGREQAEQVAGLGEVVGIVLAVVPAVGRAVQGQRRLGEGGRLLPLALGVGLVGDGAAVVAVHAHGAVTVVGVVGAARRVHGDLVVVHTQAVACGIAIREQARLQHAVGRGADARHQVGRRERGLLHIGVVVARVAVELHHAHFDQRVVLLAPDLGQVEGVEAVGLGFMLGHDLHAQLPARELAALDGFEQVALAAFTVGGDDGGRLGIGEVLDALLADPVELDPVAFVAGVDEAVGVRAEAVHVAVAARNAPVAHDDGDLVQRLGQAGPEVPVVLGRAQVGVGVALDGLV